MTTTENMMTPEEIKRRQAAHEAWLADPATGERWVTRGADLTGANLTGADLTGADLTGAILARANLTCATLTRADLTDADLTDAVLAGADLTDAILSDAILSDAYLTRATLTRTILVGAILRGATLPAGYAIASLCFGGWPVTITPTTTSIGCETHPNDWWRGLGVGDRRLAAMHEDAPTWWREHRTAVLALIDDIEAVQ